MSPSAVAFRALVRKDVVAFLRDRRALLVSVLTPIAIAAFFGFVFGGGGDSAVAAMPVAVVDLDASALSGELVTGLRQDAALALEVTTEAGARERVRTGKLRAAIIVPAGFGVAASRALFGAVDRPTLQLLYDPSQSFVRPIIEGLLTQHVMQSVTRDLFSVGGSTRIVDEALERARRNPALDPGLRTDLVAMLEGVRRFQARPAPAPPSAAAGAPGSGVAAGGLSVPFTLRSVGISTGPRYNAYAHSFAGMSVQFILFMGIDAGVTLLMMRQQGVWRRLRAAPVSRRLLLGSRVTATALIALLILSIVYAVAATVFGVRISGSILGFVAVAVAFALLAASTGLMIAALGRSLAATRGLSVLAVLMLVMLGGAWVPTFVFPDWLQRVSTFVPTRWAVDGLDAMTWRGLPFVSSIAPTLRMLACALVFTAVAVWRFDWEAD